MDDFVEMHVDIDNIDYKESNGYGLKNIFTMKSHADALNLLQ